MSDGISLQAALGPDYWRTLTNRLSLIEKDDLARLKPVENHLEEAARRDLVDAFKVLMLGGLSSWEASLFLNQVKAVGPAGDTITADESSSVKSDIAEAVQAASARDLLDDTSSKQAYRAAISAITLLLKKNDPKTYQAFYATYHELLTDLAQQLTQSFQIPEPDERFVRRTKLRVKVDSMLDDFNSRFSGEEGKRLLKIDLKSRMAAEKEGLATEGAFDALPLDVKKAAICRLEEKLDFSKNSVGTSQELYLCDKRLALSLLQTDAEFLQLKKTK